MATNSQLRIRRAIIKYLSAYNIPASFEAICDSTELANEIRHLPFTNDDIISVRAEIEFLQKQGLIQAVPGYDNVYSIAPDIYAQIINGDPARPLAENEFIWGIEAFRFKNRR